MSRNDEPELQGGAICGERFAQAVKFACDCHAGQWRKGSRAPYVTHPMAVASLVAEYGGDDEQAIAALLHDTMEDCGVSGEQITTLFGAQVAAIVISCTDTTEQVKPPWRPRKEAHIKRIRDLDVASKLVIACDKLHNARSITADLRRASIGAQVWDRFSAERDDVIWYYRSVLAALSNGWDNEVLHELEHTIDQFGPSPTTP